MSSIRRFYKPLQEFLSSNSDFKIIYKTSPNFINSSTKRLCILDSSFNPPHLGHDALVEESLSYNYGIKETNSERSIILLLSIKNADKLTPQPASFENRIEMMYLMAKYLNEKFKIDIGIGLTKHAKFVDKSISILSYLKSDPDIVNSGTNKIKLTFLVGFDTLIRILDPKYYLPDKLSNSLNEFMKSTDLFCLTRNDTSVAINEQSNYIGDIIAGKHEHIPKHWSKNIFLFNNVGDQIGFISSSNIRSGIAKNSDEWYDKVIPEIREFIIKENLYKN